MAVGKNIRDRRIELKMTQGDLAQKTGYERSMIAKIETNKVDLSIEKIDIIAKVLNINPAYLAGWSNNPDTCKKLSKDELYELYGSLVEEDQDLIVGIMRRLSKGGSN